MKLLIKKLILWSRNPANAPREIPFSVDRINVLTGKSGTGKSTVSAIIDYCLGGEKCAIPVGMIRDKCAWYGLLLELEYGEVLLARRDPDSQQSTGDMYLVEGTDIQIPTIAPKSNINIEAVKDMMNRLSRIPTISVKEGTGDVDRTDYPSFRDMAAFNFQPQHIVANPYTLFFKTDTTEHREKLQSIFPFVLGSVTPALLLHQRELKNLEKEEKKLQSDIDSHRRAAKRWLDDVESYYIQAKRYGLISAETDDRTRWSPEEYLLKLRAAQDSFEANRPPEICPGIGSRYAEELKAVFDQENALASEVGDLSRRLAKLERLGSAFDEYTKEETENNDRLASVGWFKNRLSHLDSCPFCASAFKKPPESLKKLIEVANAFSELSRNIGIAPTRLDVERQTIRQVLQTKEEELKAVRNKRIAIEDKNKQQAQHRQDIRHIYYFAGQLAQALQNFLPSEQQTDAEQRLSDYRQRIDALRREVNSGQIKKRYDAALEAVSRTIAQYAEGFLLEHRAENVALDTKELTVKFNGPKGRTDYLFEVGSGQNWVGYHLATLLAIHEYVLKLPDNPVPSFLVIDQPSQVYFPESSWNSIDEEPSYSVSSSVSEDIKGVQRIFGQLNAFLERTRGNVQIIVTEHAGSITWKDVEKSIHVVGNWRGDNVDYLIPKSWV